MGGGFVTIAYGTAVGFALAGVLASAFEAVTGRRLSFRLEERASLPAVAAGLLLRLLAGPIILMQGALHRLAEGRSGPLWLIAVLAAAAGWSFLWGMVVIETALGLSAG